MIKYLQFMHDYLYFLSESKVHFDSFESTSLHMQLWKPWQKLQLFNTDRAMEFFLPFYSSIGRPAKNQPQILRSFILFFFLYSKGLTPPSLTLWVKSLSHDCVLAALISCTTVALPLLGSYFDFMDRLSAAPASALYSRNKLLPSLWNSSKPKKPKDKKQKAHESRPKIALVIANRMIDGRYIPFNFE